MSTELTKRALLQAAQIGRDAAHIYLLSRELRDALEEFVRVYPDSAATEAAVTTALGSSRGEEELSCDASHYNSLPNECRGWLFLLNLMGDLFENIAPHQN